MGLTSKIVHIAMPVAVHNELLPNLLSFSMQIRRCVMKFCKFDNILIRICV